MRLPERGVSGRSGASGDCGAMISGGGINVEGGERAGHSIPVSFTDVSNIGGIVPKPCLRAAGTPSVIPGTSKVGRMASSISIVRCQPDPKGYEGTKAGPMQGTVISTVGPNMWRRSPRLMRTVIEGMLQGKDAGGAVGAGASVSSGDVAAGCRVTN